MFNSNFGCAQRDCVFEFKPTAHVFFEKLVINDFLKWRWFPCKNTLWIWTTWAYNYKENNFVAKNRRVPILTSFTRLSTPPAGESPISSQKSTAISWPPGAWKNKTLVRKLIKNWLKNKPNQHRMSVTQLHNKTGKEVQLNNFVKLVKLQQQQQLHVSHCFAFWEFLNDTIKTNWCLCGQCYPLIGLALQIYIKQMSK